MAEDNHVIIHIHKPGFNEKLFFCISGIIVSIPITLYFGVFSSHACLLFPTLSSLCTTVLFTPFIEEFSKVFPLFYRHGETEKSFFTLGFLTGLGFGITEFILYVFGPPGASPLIRFPAIFFHASSTSITAYGIATKRPLPFYLIAVALHLTNNVLASSDVFWLTGGLAVIIITYYLSWYLYHKTSDRIVKNT